MRTFSSLRGRNVVTESGLRLGRCHDVRAELEGPELRVTALVIGRRGRLEHFGIGGQAGATSARVRDTDTIAWEAVVGFEQDEVVVRNPVEGVR